MNRALPLTIAIAMLIAVAAPVIAAGPESTTAAGVKPGDVITRDNAAKVVDLVSPGNYVLVRQGMEMKIVSSRDYNWPAPSRVRPSKIRRRRGWAPTAN